MLFSPPANGAFKTLTVGNYVGSGAGLTLNAALGGNNSPADQLIINGGTATGATMLTIRNVGGAGAQTTGAGIPVIVAKNGGSIAPNAFALGGPVFAGGYTYNLDAPSANEISLVSLPGTTPAQATSSVETLQQSKQASMITGRVLGSVLLGANEQVSCSSCGSGFASVGSFALGAHGRWGITDKLTLLGGFSFGEYQNQGVSVGFSPTVAASLLYDFTDLGRSRPFIEAGGGLTPYQPTNYSRAYANGNGTATGDSFTINHNATLFARVGYVARLTPIDEAAILADVSESWQATNGYSELYGPNNPFPASQGAGVDDLSVARVGGQYTHLLLSNIELNGNLALAHSFAGTAGPVTTITGFGPITASVPGPGTWLEYGGRVGYRLSDRMAIDAFVLGTTGEIAGHTIHGGLGLRYAF